MSFKGDCGSKLHFCIFFHLTNTTQWEKRYGGFTSKSMSSYYLPKVIPTVLLSVTQEQMLQKQCGKSTYVLCFCAWSEAKLLWILCQ